MVLDSKVPCEHEGTTTGRDRPLARWYVVLNSSVPVMYAAPASLVLTTHTHTSTSRKITHNFRVYFLF